MMQGPLPAGLTFLNVKHDHHCPGAHGEPEACCCDPDFELHQDERRFVQSVTQNRAQRRAAERAARSAIRRAAKKGGAR